ncbi:MAG TPA: MerR family transcriptional regulator [Chloroflexia bacterium]|nr:MerR family transcriptional regulator [Chloroflexia bacterium]
MIKIGDFARIGRVSVKTLRYYDDLGLLRAARVDRFTGYRYYAFTQLPRLRRILALKDLGLSLEEVAAVLDRNLPPGEISAMLRQRQAALRGSVTTLQDQLARVTAWLQQLEQENTMPDYEIVLKAVPALRVAGSRGVIPDMDQVGPTFDRLFDQVRHYIVQHGGQPGAPGIALWHDTFADRTQDIEVAAAIPASVALPAGAPVHVHDLPAVPQMACVVHHGPFTTMGAAYEALLRWMAANGYRAHSPTREVYLAYPEGGDLAGLITEIQFPIEKV